MLGCDTRLSPLVKDGEVKSLCRPGVCTLGSACVTPAEEVLVMWWWCDGLRVGLSGADGDVLEAREGDLLWENSVAGVLCQENIDYLQLPKDLQPQVYWELWLY